MSTTTATVTIADLAREYDMEPFAVAVALDLPGGDLPDSHEVDATFAREALDLLAVLAADRD